MIKIHLSDGLARWKPAPAYLCMHLHPDSGENDSQDRSGAALPVNQFSNIFRIGGDGKAHTVGLPNAVGMP
jgi:hypothetical protein